MNLHQLIKLGLTVGGILLMIAMGMQLYFLIRTIRHRSAIKERRYLQQEAEEQQRQYRRYN